MHDAAVKHGRRRAARASACWVRHSLGFIVGPMMGGLLGAYDLRLPFYAAA